MRTLRWDCQAKGCFRQLCPRLGVLDDCFPGRIGMTDVDGLVEIGGRFLFLEWKSDGGTVSTGQRILFERLTALSPRIAVIVVTGNPETMQVGALQVFQGGRALPAEPGDLDGLKARIAAWAERARNARTRPSRRAA